MTRKRNGTSGLQRPEDEAEEAFFAFLFESRSHLSERERRYRQRIESMYWVMRGPYRGCAVHANSCVSPNDRHKRFDLSGRARPLIDVMGDVRSVAPDDTPADHLYVAADVFSDLNVWLGDVVAQSSDFDDDSEIVTEVLADDTRDDIEEIEEEEPVRAIIVRRGDHPDTLPEEARYLTPSQMMLLLVLPNRQRAR